MFIELLVREKVFTAHEIEEGNILLSDLLKWVVVAYQKNYIDQKVQEHAEKQKRL